MVTWHLFVSPFVLHVFIAGGLAFAVVAVLDALLVLAPRARMTLYAAVLAVPVLSYFVYFTHIFGRCRHLFGPFSWRICVLGRTYADFLAPFTAFLLGLYLVLRLWQHFSSPLRGSRATTDTAAANSVRSALSAVGGTHLAKVTVLTNHYPAIYVRGASELCVTTGLLERLSEGELQAAVEHELAHIRGRDNLWNLNFLLKEMAFFSPLAHLAHARYCQAREEAADAAVADKHRLDLVAALLTVARRSQELMAFAEWRWSESYFVGGNDIKRRIEILLADRRTFTPMPLWAPLVLLAAIVAFIC